MLDNLNLVFPVIENQETRLEHDVAREQTVPPHPADEISLQPNYWQTDITSYFLVQFSSF